MSEAANDIVYRQARKDDMKNIHELVLKEGMITSLGNLRVAYDLNPGGWRVAQTEQGGIVGVCAGSIVNDVIATMGPYLVDKSYRGRGIGTRLWSEAQDRQGGRNIHMVASIPNVYRSIGFSAYPFIYRIMSGIPRVDNLVIATTNGTKVARAETIPIERIVEYDTSVNCGIRRPRYVQEWILHSEATTLIAYREKHQKQIEIVGLGAVRPCNNGWQMAPLYADDTNTAEALLAALVKEIPKDSTILFLILTPNTASLDLANRIGLTTRANHTPMYLKEAISLPLDRIYALSTGSFGLV